MPELEAAPKLSPKDTDVRDNLGAAYLQTGRFDEATALYHAARLHSPKDAQLPLYEGLTLTQAGKTDEAVVALKEAVRLNPKNPWESPSKAAANTLKPQQRSRVPPIST